MTDPKIDQMWKNTPQRVFIARPCHFYFVFFFFAGPSLLPEHSNFHLHHSFCTIHSWSRFYSAPNQKMLNIFFSRTCLMAYFAFCTVTFLTWMSAKSCHYCMLYRNKNVNKFWRKRKKKDKHEKQVRRLDFEMKSHVKSFIFRMNFQLDNHYLLFRCHFSLSILHFLILSILFCANNLFTIVIIGWTVCQNSNKRKRDVIAHQLRNK